MAITRLARVYLGLFVSLLSWGALSPLAQASIEMSPLQVEFAPSQRSAQITVRNSNDEPLALQVRVFQWSQPEYMGMALLPTTAITASPAIVTLAPGATQLIRVLRREDLPSDREHYFRLLLDELPDPGAASRNAVQMLTRYSLPVFIEPRLAGRAELSASRVHCADTREFIEVTNTGSRRARIAQWQLLAADASQAGHGKASPSARVVAQKAGLSGYVLPGGRLRIPVTFILPATDLQWQVKTDTRDWQTTLAMPAEASACDAAP